MTDQTYRSDYSVSILKNRPNLCKCQVRQNSKKNVFRDLDNMDLDLKDFIVSNETGLIEEVV